MDKLEIDVTATSIDRCISSVEFDTIISATNSISRAFDEIESARTAMVRRKVVSERDMISHVDRSENAVADTLDALRHLPPGMSTFMKTRANQDIINVLAGTERRIAALASELRDRMVVPSRFSEEVNDITDTLIAAQDDITALRATSVFNCLIG